MKFEKSKLEPLKLNIGGTEYPLRATFGGMAELEELFEMPFLEIFNKFIANNYKANEIKKVLYVLLKGGGVELAIEDLDDVDFATDAIDVLSDALLRANTVVSAIEEQKTPEDAGSEKKKETT